jgi:indole-3-glycerol phosphate synthase
MPDAGQPDVLAAVAGAARRITEVRRAALPEDALERAIERLPSVEGRFDAALAGTPAPRVIAECKRRSPSRGVLRRDYDPAALARAYAQGGAVAISVLTEPTFFDGAPEHLQAVRAAVSVPVLRKDFVVCRYQVLEARAWGAAAVLLIVAALNDRQLGSLLGDADRVGLATLVEAHDAGEIARALGAGARIIGVNNRDLRTLGVNTTTALDLIDRVPDNVLAVAESGIRTREDVARLQSAGYDAFLVGERLTAAADPAAALAELRCP